MKGNKEATRVTGQMIKLQLYITEANNKLYRIAVVLMYQCTYKISQPGSQQFNPQRDSINKTQTSPLL